MVAFEIWKMEIIENETMRLDAYSRSKGSGGLAVDLFGNVDQ